MGSHPSGGGAPAGDARRQTDAAEGGEPLPGTPDRQASDIGEEEAKWGALVRKLGIRSE